MSDIGGGTNVGTVFVSVRGDTSQLAADAQAGMTQALATLNAQAAQQNTTLNGINSNVGALNRNFLDAQNSGNQAASAIQNVGGSSSSAVAGVQQLGAALAGLGLEKVISTTTDAELAQARLAFQSAKLPDATKNIVAEFRDYNVELAKNSLYNKDQIAGQEAILERLKITPDAVQGATSALVDLSEATGKGLPEASQIFVQALEGQSRGLKALGIDFVRTGDAQKDAIALTAKINEIYGGFNATIQDTDAKKIADMQKAFHDFEVAVGPGLASGIEALTGPLKTVESIAESIPEPFLKIIGAGVSLAAVAVPINLIAKAQAGLLATGKGLFTQTTLQVEANSALIASDEAVAAAETELTLAMRARSLAGGAAAAIGGGIGVDALSGGGAAGHLAGGLFGAGLGLSAFGLPEIGLPIAAGAAIGGLASKILGLGDSEQAATLSMEKFDRQLRETKDNASDAGQVLDKTIIQAFLSVKDVGLPLQNFGIDPGAIADAINQSMSGSSGALDAVKDKIDDLLPADKAAQVNANIDSITQHFLSFKASAGAATDSVVVGFQNQVEASKAAAQFIGDIKTVYQDTIGYAEQFNKAQISVTQADKAVAKANFELATGYTSLKDSIRDTTLETEKNSLTQAQKNQGIKEATDALNQARKSEVDAARAVTKAVEDETDAEQAAIDARLALADAQRAVLDAQQNDLDAQTKFNQIANGYAEGTKERTQAESDYTHAVEDQLHAFRSLAAAQDSYRDSLKSIADAQKTLNDLVTKHTIGSREDLQAQRDLQSAQFGAQDAAFAIADARTKAIEAAREGGAGSEAARKAREDLAKATLDQANALAKVADQQRSLADIENPNSNEVLKAQDALTKANQASSDAFESIADAQQALTDADSKLADSATTLSEIEHGYAQSTDEYKKALKDRESADRSLESAHRSVESSQRAVEKADEAIVDKKQAIIDAQDAVTKSQERYQDAVVKAYESVVEADIAERERALKAKQDAADAWQKHIEAQDNVTNAYLRQKDSVDQLVLAELTLQASRAWEDNGADLSAAINSSVAAARASGDNALYQALLDFEEREARAGAISLLGPIQHGTVLQTIFGGGRAEGGPVNAGTLYRVNEQSSSNVELFKPSVSGTVIPLGGKGDYGGGGLVIAEGAVQINMRDGASAQDVAGEVSKALNVFAQKVRVRR